MAIKQELATTISDTIKTTYWTVGHLEVLPDTKGNAKLRYRLDGYVSEADYRSGKKAIDTRAVEKTVTKEEIGVWGVLYQIAEEQLEEFKGAMSDEAVIS